ncbi:MAG: single-stranded-DNA-specific exonuclease RecJ, partial [Candidatus Hydrogenedentes bacterium]|nr:single-stranded-DNA-specific exonuclease RecJ [Candidatus Hydrogenedentota bacterium]
MKPSPVLRKWRIAEAARKESTSLAEGLGVPPVVAHLLWTRGVCSVAAGKRFLDPLSEAPGDPLSLTGMGAAVERLQSARTREEHVLIYGDYDVDGISATATLKRGLDRFGIDKVSCGLPNRFSDGYGLTPEAVDRAKAAGADVIVTVDNGSKAYAAANRAVECGLDLIVTDHHSLDGELPEAVAVVNPKRDDPDGPFADASGSVMALMLSRALTGELHEVGLATLGVVADMAPLRHGNRGLVARGLDELRAESYAGLNALAEKAGVRVREVRAEDIAFQLGPRLNAAGRMGSAEAALELLLTDSEAQASLLAGELNEANLARRDVEQRIYEDILAELDANLDDAQRTIIAARRGWHPGVIGIVASKIQHAFGRPVLLIALDDKGVGKASARSTPDFDMVGGLGVCREYLDRFGGHRAAAGFSLREERIAAFSEALEAHAQEVMEDGPRYHEIQIDAQVSLSELDGQLMGALDSLEPFGQSNPAPVFCC